MFIHFIKVTQVAIIPPLATIFTHNSIHISIAMQECQSVMW